MSSQKVDFSTDIARVSDHISPVFNALPKRHQGAFGRFDDIRTQSNSGPLVVARPQALRRAKPLNRPIILMTHDMGETLGSGSHISPSYLRNPADWYVNMMLPPGEHLAEKQREAFPHVPVHTIGCPKLDRWHTQIIEKPNNDVPVVIIALTWFWQRSVSLPKGAFPLYKEALLALATKRKFKLLNRLHPKAEPRIKKALPLPTVSYDWAMRNADVLISDYGSMLFEFASLDKPVVLLNAPWYKNIPQGESIRFWKCSNVGVNCWSPFDLEDAIDEALLDKEDQRQKRLKAVDYVYPHRGDSAVRAARYIMTLIKPDDQREELRMPEKYVKVRALKSFTGAGVNAKKGEVVEMPAKWIDRYALHGLVARLGVQPEQNVQTQTVEPTTVDVQGQSQNVSIGQGLSEQHPAIDTLERRGPYYVMPDGSRVLGREAAEAALAGRDVEHKPDN